MKRRGFLAIVLALLATVVSFLIAQPGPQVTWTWTAPTTGPAAVEYVGEYQLSGNVETIHSITTRSLTLPYPEGGSARLRVAGIDSLGRQGVWSAWSELLVDPGPVGPPGTPVYRIN